jgi:hypothetical protein
MIECIYAGGLQVEPAPAERVSALGEFGYSGGEKTEWMIHSSLSK